MGRMLRARIGTSSMLAAGLAVVGGGVEAVTMAGTAAMGGGVGVVVSAGASDSGVASGSSPI